MKADAGNYEDYPFAVEFYDHTPYYKEMNDLGFWTEYAVASGGPVLELGSGTGRALIPIARARIDVVGLDASQRMVDACRDKLNHEPKEVSARVQLVRSSMEQFEIEQKFALVFSAFRSFQILETAEQQMSCLACVRDHLIDGGRLILDVFDPHLPFLIDEKLKEEWGRDDRFAMPDGRAVEVRYRNPEVDLARQTIDCEQIFYVDHPDGRKERLVQSFRLRYLFRYELEHLLVRSGFEIEEVFGGFDRCPFGTHRPGEIIAIARKPA
jgi:SAM-dependent methyltransferase